MQVVPKQQGWDWCISHVARSSTEREFIIITTLARSGILCIHAVIGGLRNIVVPLHNYIASGHGYKNWIKNEYNTVERLSMKKSVLSLDTF